jgi:hypothetical protein
MGPGIVLQNVEILGPGPKKPGTVGIKVEGADNSIVGSKISKFETGIVIGGAIASTGTKVLGPNMLIDFVKTGINVAGASGCSLIR